MNARVILAVMIVLWGIGAAPADDKADDKAGDKAGDKGGNKTGDQGGGVMDPQAKAFAEWQQQMQQQMMKRFDADGDGKLNDGEKLAMQQAMAQHGLNFGMSPDGFPGAEQFRNRFDVNGDGKIDPRESMMAQQAFQRMMGHGGQRGGVRGGGGPSSGIMPQPAMPVGPAVGTNQGKVSPLVKRYDKDGDGKLNADEKAAAQADLKKKDGKDAKKEKGKK